MIVVVSRGMRWASAVGTVLALVLLASGCSDDDDEAGTTTPTAAPTTTSSSAPTTSTSTTAPPPTTATTEPTTFPSDPAEYTAELVRAWGVGDRARADLFAGTAAVDALFAYADPGGPRWDLVGCDGAAGTAYCSYRDPERQVTVSLGIPMADGNTIDGPHEVGVATFSPPS